jgi:tetratricopeptide (TPR) repeat protein
MRVHISIQHATIALACALFLTPAVQARPEIAPDTAPEVNNSSLNAPLFYQLLIGEIEYSAGQSPAAFELILDAARKANDEVLFKRASTIALQMRDGPKTLTAVQSWRKSLPKSLEAARYEAQVLIAMQRTADAMPAISQLIALTPSKERPGVIAALPELLSTHPEKKQIPPWLEPVLKPWLKDPITRQSAQLTLGRLLNIAEQHDQALELAQLAHSQDPKSQEPAVLALELMPSTPQSEALIKDFLKIQPQASALRMAYARALTTQQRYPEALEQFQAAAQRDPRLASAWLGQGALFLELRQPAETTRVVNIYLQKAAKGEISSATAVASAPVASLEVDDEDSQATTPAANTTTAYLLLSKAAQQQRDFVSAKNWLDKVNDPGRAMDVLLRRATIMAEQGQLDKAIQMVRQAPSNSPDAPRDKINIEAQLLTNAKQWATAETVLDKANERFPNDADFLYQQSMLLEKINRIDDMEKLLKKVIAIRPDHFHAYNALGYSLADRNLRLPEAKQLITKALSIAPGEPFITDSLGWVEYRLGNFNEAIRLLKTAYRLRPDVEIAVHLGEVLWANNQQDEAKRILREASTKDASNEVLREALTRLKVAP